MTEENVRAVYSAMSALRVHWSHVITIHLTVAVPVTLAIWAQLGKDSKDYALGAALSSILLGLWRWYARFLDRHITNLYPDLLFCERTLGLEPKYGISGYLTRGLSLPTSFFAGSPDDQAGRVRRLVGMRRIGSRGHFTIDSVALLVVAVGTWVSVSSLNFWSAGALCLTSKHLPLLGNLVGAGLILYAMTCFHKWPRQRDVQRVLDDDLKQVSPSPGSAT